MVNTRFEAYKLQREMRRSGQVFQFRRPAINDFGEPVKDENGDYVFQGNPIEIEGLYHEVNSYISVVTGDTTRTRTKKEPMVLCMYEDASGLQVGDVVQYNNKTFRYSGIVNVQEWGIIGDISLEVFDDGLHD